MIGGLIFDFDGLILETEGPIFQSWQELYQEYRCELTQAEWAVLIGTAEAAFDPLALLQERAGQSLDVERVRPLRLQRELELIAQQPILPGVQAYLNEAQALGLRLGVASSSPRAWVAGHLERLGLRGYFATVKTCEDVGRTKPEPALYQAALAELNLAPNEAIALEDSPNGVLAAKRAGLFCVAVPNDLTRALPLEHADLRLESLADLPLRELLQQVEKRNHQ